VWISPRCYVSCFFFDVLLVWSQLVESSVKYPRCYVSCPIFFNWALFVVQLAGICGQCCLLAAHSTYSYLCYLLTCHVTYSHVLLPTHKGRHLPTCRVTYSHVLLPTLLSIVQSYCCVTYSHVVLPTHMSCYLPTCHVTYSHVVIPTHMSIVQSYSCAWALGASGAFILKA